MSWRWRSNYVIHTYKRKTRRLLNFTSLFHYFLYFELFPSLEFIQWQQHHKQRRLFFNVLSLNADNLENVKNFNWKNILLFPWVLATLYSWPIGDIALEVIMLSRVVLDLLLIEILIRVDKELIAWYGWLEWRHRVTSKSWGRRLRAWIKRYIDETRKLTIICLYTVKESPDNKKSVLKEPNSFEKILKKTVTSSVLKKVMVHLTRPHCKTTKHTILICGPHLVYPRQSQTR